MPSDRRPLLATVAPDWPVARSGGFAPAGRMNARTAARAETRLEEMDRLATARNCRERGDHRLRGDHAGADPQGHRYRRHPDRLDRDSPRQHRAGRDLRVLRVLYADLLRL